MEGTLIIAMLGIFWMLGVSVYYGYISYYRIDINKLKKLFPQGNEAYSLRTGRTVSWFAIATAIVITMIIFII